MARSLWWFPDSEDGTPLVAVGTPLGDRIVGRRVRPATDRWRLPRGVWWTPEGSLCDQISELIAPHTAPEGAEHD